MKNFILAIFLFFTANVAFSACEFDVTVNDALAFSTTDMNVESSCESITINLSHEGSLPAAAMGHNWVLTATDQVDPVAIAGIPTGLAGNYLPADDARIIAATKIIGGGESTSITFSIDKLDAGGDYTFFCSFPGHWAVMRGKFNIS